LFLSVGQEVDEFTRCFNLGGVQREKGVDFVSKIEEDCDGVVNSCGDPNVTNQQSLLNVR
jgi:hypothetical protein